MRTILCLLVLSLSAFSARSQGFLSGFFDETNQLFGKYALNGRIDYIAIKNNEKLFKSIITNLEEMDMNGKTKEEKKAFYINAYNLLVIKSVIENWPMAATKDVKGFFDEKKHKIAGEMLTLNEIEQTRLYDVFSDPRLHFVLVKANKGCPDAVNYGYYPVDVEKKLDDQTKNALNNARYVQVKDEQKVVFLPPLFKIYEKDFLAGNKSVLDFVKKYRDSKIPGSYKIDYYPAEVALNDKKR